MPVRPRPLARGAGLSRLWLTVPLLLGVLVMHAGLSINTGHASLASDASLASHAAPASHAPLASHAGIPTPSGDRLAMPLHEGAR
ncbi:hypothetical protein [Frankia canadensis]|uniref:hypothetical protein n=1 Tax=Frankia canadensis TaxID=1836972 RepID=UPI001055BB17|nr:hypothetical protein [Frankia canadensis]